MIGKIILHIAFVPTVNSWWFLGSTATGKFSILYSHLCLETVFLALKLTQDCYIHYNIFFLKTGNVIINWLLLSDATCRTEKLSSPSDYPSPEGNGSSKIEIFKLVSEMVKIWKCSLGYSKIPIFHLFHELGKTEAYTTQGQPFKIQILKL